jgi:hypothetical protein
MADTSKLTDLLDFMTQLKDFNFQDAATKCCAEAVKAVKKCVLDKCWTWNDYTMILNSLKVAYDGNTLGPLIIALTGAAEMYVGMNGQTEMWANSLPTFFDAAGAIVMMIVGSLAGGWVGMETIKATVKTSFWTLDTSANTGYASSYLIYGGRSVIGSLMGLFSVFWIIMWLFMALMLVATPYYLTMYLQKEMKGAANAGDSLNSSYRHLTNGLIIGVASWGAAIALTESVNRLVGFFDRQPTTLSKTGSTDETALVVDVVNHSIIITFYYLFAMTVAGSGYAYVYYQLNPEELPKNMQ